MSTRSLRNRISSRLSSPAITVEAEQADDSDADRNGDTGQDDWVEPPVRRLPPSYQDHKGLERLGVLELQQPLGEPPSQKLLQRLKLNFSRPSNRASPMQTEEGVTPSVESERPEFGSPREAERLSEPLPHELLQGDQVVISSPPRGRPAKRDADEMRQPSYTMMDMSHFLPPSVAPPKPISIQEQLRQDRVSAYLEKAVEEAERNGDVGLLPGLQNVKDKAFKQRSLWVVLDAIAHQSPNEEQLSIFKRHIKKGLKRHRRQSALSSNSVQSPLPDNYSQSPGQPAVVVADDSYPNLSPAATALIPAPTFTSPFRPRPSPSHRSHTHPNNPPVHLSPSSRRSKMDSANDRSPRQPGSSETPRRKRAGSNSSTSTLSSAKSIPEEFAPEQADGDGEDGIADERPDSKSLKGGQRQGSDRAKLRSAGISHPNSKHPFHAFPDVAKIAAKKLKKSKEDLDYDPADVERRRRRFEDDSFRDYNYRFHDTVNERNHIPYLHEDYPATSTDDRIPHPPIVHAQPVTASQLQPDSSFGFQSAPNKSLPNGTSRKRNYDEMADDDDRLSSLSSTPDPVFVPPPPLHARMSSRAGTPRMAKHPVITKARKSARVMISPNKPKNGGITAGISRVGQNRDTVIGNGAESGPEENDEFCASCGGEGTLLCCDGCSNSLHHSCLEPPLDPDEEVDGAWYCPQCQAKRNKNVKQARGILGKVVNRVQDIIPKAFALPMEIRDYFDGVRTGDGGEYEEFGQARTQVGMKMNRAGFFEEPNYKESRDGKGKLLTCYQCGKSANGRDLIPCDFCEHKWHLDCLDPPLAVPPRRRIGDKVNATWRCPLHVEQDLSGIGRQAEAAPGDLGRRPRPRKPKNGKPIDVSMPRGFKNNGVIEVELIKDEMPGIKEIEMNGGIFRLPEMGIRLDFIDRVKKSWFEDESFARLSGRPPKMKQRTYRATGSPLYHKPDHLVFKMQEPEFFKGAQAIAFAEGAKANKKLLRKTYAEQQAALNLVALAQNSPGYNPDAIADLTNSLISEAPESAQLAIQQGEKGTLLQLQQLLQRRLNILDGVDMPLPAPPSYPTPAPVTHPVLKPKPLYQPIQPAPPPPMMMQHTPSPYAPGGMSNGNGYPPRPPMLHNYSSFNQNQQTQGQYRPHGHSQSQPQTPIQATPTTPQRQNTSSHANANSFDAALDPRLFGNGNVGYVEDDGANDADVEMDGN